MTSAALELERPSVRVRGVVAAAALMAVCALAAGLRFYAFDRVYLTPYYDAAVRSMGLSWHNFFYGTLEPSGQVSIDKAPVDLWLQVASTKLLGFSSVSLRLPAAIAGTLSVLLLYDLVRRGFGRGAGLAAALALAVLPASVLTSRSDTMDAVMSLLLLLSAWLVMRAPPAHRATAVVAAGFVAGLAFEVKLFEAVVAVPALALLGWLALEGGAARRARGLLLAGLAYLLAAASWPVAASLLPGNHPYPLGSTDGQIWNAILVYNGVQRFGHGPTGATAPGPLRLFQAGPPREFGALIGVELAVALSFGALAVLCRRAGTSPALAGADRSRLAVAWGIGVWLVTGFLVASFMGRQWPRYLEAFTPAVAGALGLGLVAVARAAADRRGVLLALASCAVGAGLAGLLAGGERAALRVALLAGSAGVAFAAAAAVTRRRRSGFVLAATTAILVAALAVPFATSARLVRAGAGDSAPAGNLPATTLDPLSTYLRAHQGTARYEVAGASILKSTALIVRDARPVLTLVGPGGRPLISTHELARYVLSGQVRYALIGRVRCVRGAGAGCAPAVRWVLAHGTDVSRRAGLPHRHTLYRL
jgi:4-amino-4-deoxy-L-arabinose transferase-like glycosyltransferase